MPYLNFTEKSIDLKMSAHARFETQLAMQIGSAELAVLSDGLSNLLLSDHPERVELRVDLPSKWTIFWKLREGEETRLLLAHPEEDTWVATVAMTRPHCEAIVGAFSKLSEIPEILSGLGSTSRISNFDLTVSLLGNQSVVH